MKVSDSLWDRLEEKLDQAPVKEQKPKMIWLRYAAVILLMVGLGGSFLVINNKSHINENHEFANQTNNQNPAQATINQPEINEAEKLIPTKINSEIDNQKSAVENGKDSSNPLILTESVKKVNQANNLIPEKENTIEKEELQTVSRSEEKLAQNEAPKPRVKYVSSSDLLFGVEIDKAKTETPKSTMGINTPKIKSESDFPNPKRIKLFGITLYDKDSTTTK